MDKRKWLDLVRIMILKPELIMMDEVIVGPNFTQALRS